MKKIIVLFFVLVSFCARAQNTHLDITFNAKIISEPNEPIIAAINRHIEVLETNEYELNDKDDFFILVLISPKLTKWDVPKHIIDSIYKINDFKTELPIDSLTPKYYVSIVLSDKKHRTEGWPRFKRENVYYCNYNNYDILISSDLNIIFKSDNHEMQVTQHLSLLRDETKDYSLYSIWTQYYMWNKYIREVRFKDLIWPVWTGRTDQF